MSEYKIGFIGTGNMGSAIAKAVSKIVPGKDIIVSNRTASKSEALAKEIDCRVADNHYVAANAKYIFLGVKPQVFDEMLKDIAEILALRKDRFVLVSMAAGIEIKKILNILGDTYPIIRIMPNTPVSIGEGVVPFSVSENVLEDEINEFCNFMSCAGLIDRVNEGLIDAACAVSGCGPAFVYMFADAMASAAVECGMPRTKALEYATQTIIGSSYLIAKSGKHPEQLRDEVCSPGGATIAGVHSLEHDGFRNAVMNAVKSAFDKTKKL